MENFDKSSLERAEEETKTMKEKIKTGEAEDYSRVEEIVEKEDIDKENFEKEVSRISQRYVDLPKHQLDQENIQKILSEIEALDKGQENPETLFLKGMLNLESFYLEQSESVIKKYELNSVFFKNAFESFSKILEKKEEFEINAKNQEKNNVGFGDLSSTNIYLSDLYLFKYYNSKDSEDWYKADDLYTEAIGLEKERGLQYELRTILALRRIVHYIGNEDVIKMKKTTKRSDLRHETADMILEYSDIKKGEVVESYIDLTARDKKKHGSTVVIKIPYEKIDYLSKLDFERPPFVKREEAGSLRNDKTKEICARLFSFSSSMGDSFNISNKEKYRFRSEFFIAQDKFEKYFPAIPKQSINQLKESIELGADMTKII